MGATRELGIDPNSDQHVKKEENGVRRESIRAFEDQIYVV